MAPCPQEENHEGQDPRQSQSEIAAGTAVAHQVMGVPRLLACLYWRRVQVRAVVGGERAGLIRTARPRRLSSVRADRLRLKRAGSQERRPGPVGGAAAEDCLRLAGRDG